MFSLIVLKRTLLRNMFPEAFKGHPGAFADIVAREQ